MILSFGPKTVKIGKPTPVGLFDYLKDVLYFANPVGWGSKQSKQLNPSAWCQKYKKSAKIIPICWLHEPFYNILKPGFMHYYIYNLQNFKCHSAHIYIYRYRYRRFRYIYIYIRHPSGYIYIITYYMVVCACSLFILAYNLWTFHENP